VKENSVCVIGAGPVGIWTASKLLENGFQVELIEAGYEERESSLLSLKDYDFLTPSALPKNAHKVGGGSNLWMSRIGEFLESDFRRIPGVRENSWPIEKQALDMHYKSCYKFLTGGTQLDEEFIDSRMNSVRKTLPKELDLRLFRFGRLDVFRNLLLEMKKDSRFVLTQGCRVAELMNQEEIEKIAVHGRYESGEKLIRTFDFVVVAGGSLQSTALLRNSIDFSDFRNFALVGRGLMEHFDGYVGTLRISRTDLPVLKSFALKKNRTLKDSSEDFGVGIRFAESFSRLNKFVTAHLELAPFQPRYHFDTTALSLRYPKMNHYLKKSLLLSIFQVERLLKKSFFALKQLYLSLIQETEYSIWLKGEEVLSEDSFLEFTSSKVLYGHRISRESSLQIRRVLQSFSDVIANNRMGTVKFYKSLFRKNHEFYLRPNWHPMGTLRASALTETVCDPNFAYVNSKRIFVASSATFPTGSNANPTFTAMATGGFIAEHLSKLQYD